MYVCVCVCVFDVFSDLSSRDEINACYALVKAEMNSDTYTQEIRVGGTCICLSLQFVKDSQEMIMIKMIKQFQLVFTRHPY